MMFVDVGSECTMEKERLRTRSEGTFDEKVPSIYMWNQLIDVYMQCSTTHAINHTTTCNKRNVLIISSSAF